MILPKAITAVALIIVAVVLAFAVYVSSTNMPKSTPIVNPTATPTLNATSNPTGLSPISTPVLSQLPTAKQSSSF